MVFVDVWLLSLYDCMIVPPGIFSLVYRKLTHGCVEKHTASGRVAERWVGAVSELDNRLSVGGHNVVDRGGVLVYTINHYFL